MRKPATDELNPVRSAARGPHWIAWVPDQQGRPEGSIVVVAGTREEAEKRARLRIAQNARE